MASTGSRKVLVLGQLRAEDRAVVAASAHGVDADVVTTVSAKTALAMIQSEQPLLILIETMAVGADTLCQGVRSDAKNRGLPIIGMPRELNDRAFSRAFDWGVDDLVRLGDWGALERRLRAVHEIQIRPAAVARIGEAIVADRDQARCTVLGRVLTGAGYNVRYAVDPRSLAYYAGQQAVGLIVANPNIGELRETLLQVREHNPGAAWVIAAAPNTVEQWANQIADLERVGVTNALGPPENIVFFANELLNQRTTEARRAVRNLYGTTVAFRCAGTSKDEYGFTYNVSRHGTYIRSLLPIPGDEMWLDIRPPRADRFVRLLAQVVWRKQLGAPFNGGTPPGFAVRVVDGLAQDMELWAEGCEAIEVGSRRKPISLRPGVIGLGPLETPSDETPVLPRQSPLPVPQHEPASSAESVVPAQLDALSLGDDLEWVPPEPSRNRRARGPALAALTLVLGAVMGGLVTASVLLWAAGDFEPIPVVEATQRKDDWSSRALRERLAISATSAAAPVAPRDVFPASSHSQGTAVPMPEPVPSGASPGAKPAELTETDLANLRPGFGYLKILASVQAGVLVSGLKVGETNAWTQARCGNRFVRVVDERGALLDAGTMVSIQCQGATTVHSTAKKPTVEGEREPR